MNWQQQQIHCPNCGARAVWQDDDDAGDYYAGTPMYCVSCKVRLSDIEIANPTDPRVDEWTRKQIDEACAQVAVCAAQELKS